MSTYEDKPSEIREDLLKYAQKVCRNGLDTPLPPLREINHEIPVIDLHKKYYWRPSRCPDPLLDQWVKKKEAYVASGRWLPKPVSNAMPMMMIPKPRKAGEPLRLRMVCDLRERNSNTRKLSSPLLHIDGILRRVSSSKYRSTIDLADAYEQVRVVPEHVDRTAMNTPSGTMVSLVMQQGDCNASATFQMIMTRIFAPYLGDFMDVYLDDIIIYSNSLEEHIHHVKMIIDMLDREKFYVSEKKLHFLQKELHLLGRVVSDNGIRMDPDKVDALCRWKVPTNRDLLRGFLGSAGYLADDIDRVRIPMGVLTELTGDTVPFRWEYTHQRAFEDIKNAAMVCKDHNRRPLTYDPDAPPINVVTDGCVTAGVISQGDDWRTAKVAACYSAKLNSAQQNYPVHEIEMLAGVETMLRYKDILQGAKFLRFTDHKGLVTLLQQKDLLGRQARWLEKLSRFDFEVVYVPGPENLLSDALSRLYSNEQPGTVRARSEYTYHDVIDNDNMPAHAVTMPVHVGMEGEATLMAVTRGRARRQPTGNSGARKDTALPGERQEGGSDTVRTKTTEIPSINKNSVSSTASGTNKGKPTIRIPARKSTLNERPTTDTQAPTVSNKSGDNDTHQSKELAQTTNESPPPLVDLLKHGIDNLDITTATRGRYHEDPLFRNIVERPKEHKNFRLHDGLLFTKIHETDRLCIPNITFGNRNIREALISEAHSLLAHLGSKKTLDYL